jgi:hypothetical protein
MGGTRKRASLSQAVVMYFTIIGTISSVETIAAAISLVRVCRHRQARVQDQAASGR